MKKIFVLFAALTALAGVSAQNPTAYFMEGTTLRSQFNPAFAPLRGYVNIPGLGGIQVGQNNNLALNNMLFSRGGKLVTLLDSSVSAADALSGLKSNNLLGSDARVNIIGFGAFTKNHKNFWSFDLTSRTNAEANLPYSLFDFLKNGQEGSIRNIGITLDTYLEAGFNYSFPLLGDRLYVGARVKFLIGAGRARLNYDRFDVTLDEDCWKVDASGTLDVIAAGTEVDMQNDDAGNPYYEFGDLDFSPTKPSGYGFAVDLGATYDILPNLQASLAVNDIGFISWSKKSAVSGRSAKQLEFTGVEIVDGVQTEQPDFDFDILQFTPTEAEAGTKALRATVNAGLEYEVWNHKIGVGLLYAMRFWEYKTLHNVTGSVNFHPIRWATLTGSYSVGTGGGAFGLALNLNPNWINFFIATDVLTAKHTPQWMPIKQKSMNITLGLGVPIGKRSHRVDAYVRPGDKR